MTPAERDDIEAAIRAAFPGLPADALNDTTCDGVDVRIGRGSFSPPPPPPVRFMPLSELVFTIHVGRQLAREVRS